MTQILCNETLRRIVVLKIMVRMLVTVAICSVTK